MNVYIAEFEYQGDLVLRRRRRGLGDQFTVDADFPVTFLLDGTPKALVVPKGMDTDLSSIPPWVPAWITHKVALHLEASVVHDFLYTAAGQRAFPQPREVADEIFRAAMEASGVAAPLREAMYLAVRLGGQPYWGRNRAIIERQDAGIAAWDTGSR